MRDFKRLQVRFCLIFHDFFPKNIKFFEIFQIVEKANFCLKQAKWIKKVFYLEKYPKLTEIELEIGLNWPETGSKWA